MVLTRGQQAGDPSQADQDRYPISTGNPRAAPTNNDASGITVSATGDAHGSARKPVHGSQSGQLASTLTSTYQLGAQARLSVSTIGHQTAPANSYSSSPASSGLHTPDSDSASPIRHDTQGPSTFEPTRCTVYTTHATCQHHGISGATCTTANILWQLQLRGWAISTLFSKRHN